MPWFLSPLNVFGSNHCNIVGLRRDFDAAQKRDPLLFFPLWVLFDPPSADQVIEQGIHDPEQDDEEKVKEEKRAKKDKQPDDQQQTPASHPR